MPLTIGLTYHEVLHNKVQQKYGRHICDIKMFTSTEKNEDNNIIYLHNEIDPFDPFNIYGYWECSSIFPDEREEAEVDFKEFNDIF